MRRALNSSTSPNKWTNEKRKVAWSLKHEFGLDKHKALAVFKTMFDSESDSSLSSQGLTADALAAQWNESRLARYSGWIDTNYELDQGTESGRQAAKQVATRIQTVINAKRPGSRTGETASRHWARPDQASELETREQQLPLRSSKTMAEMSFTSAPLCSKAQAKAKAAERRHLRRADLPRGHRAVELDQEYSDAEVRINEKTLIRYRSSREQALPQTPPPQPDRVSKKALYDLTKVPYSRTYGGTCMVSPKQLQASAGEHSITAEVAQLEPSKTDLFFRYWHPGSQGRNSHEGFIAGQFRRSNVEVEPPRCEDPMMLSWAENHLNRK